jgi:hypothetical protein
MNIDRLRRLLAQEKLTLRFTDHAVTEARKDGLTAEDLEDTVTEGEIIEDYGVRALFLNLTKDDRLPCRVVLEYRPSAQEAVIITAYMPDAKEWESNWKRRKQKRRR